MSNRKAGPKFVILNKDKDSRKVTRIGACWPNDYGGENLTFNVYNADEKRSLNVTHLVLEDGTKIKLGWVDRRENKERAQEQIDDADL